MELAFLLVVVHGSCVAVLVSSTVGVHGDGSCTGPKTDTLTAPWLLEININSNKTAKKKEKAARDDDLEKKGRGLRGLAGGEAAAAWHG